MISTRQQHQRRILLTTVVLLILTASELGTPVFGLLSVVVVPKPSLVGLQSTSATTTTALFHGPPPQQQDLERLVKDEDDNNKGSSNNNEKDDEDEKQQQIRQQRKKEFGQLVDKVMSASKPEHIPSLLTKHTELILSMKGEEAMETIQGILEETEQQRQRGGGEETETEMQRVMEAIDIILSFTAEFVDQSKGLDDYNKNLLGRIIKTMTVDSSGLSEREREERLDELLANERENFTRGFLRHLDGQCDRIADAPSINQEGIRLQEILRMIKTRIVEELGKDLGEGAIVLGQLVAYEDRQERIAVLDAGLTVRGLEFAQELSNLTAEALEGFQTVPGGADETLVSRVEEINQHVKAFIEENSNFQ